MQGAARPIGSSARSSVWPKDTSTCGQLVLRFIKPTVTACLARPALCSVEFFKCIQHCYVWFWYYRCCLKSITFVFFPLPKYNFLWLRIWSLVYLNWKECLIEWSHFSFWILSVPLCSSFSFSTSLSQCVCLYCEKSPCAELCKVHGVCPCWSTGWRTDRWWPHSPQRTTFLLVLIDLCGFVRDTRTRTWVFYSQTLPPFFLLSLFFVAFSSLHWTVYQIAPQVYLCPHVTNKVMQQAGVWYDLFLQTAAFVRVTLRQP